MFISDNETGLLDFISDVNKPAYITTWLGCIAREVDCFSKNVLFTANE